MRKIYINKDEMHVFETDKLNKKQRGMLKSKIWDVSITYGEDDLSSVSLFVLLDSDNVSKKLEQEYRKKLKDAGIKRSYRRKGDVV